MPRYERYTIDLRGPIVGLERIRPRRRISVGLERHLHRREDAVYSPWHCTTRGSGLPTEIRLSGFGVSFRRRH
jgi:hypothetical protein